eukprot:PITA_19235
MKALFSSQDIWDLVENGVQEPAVATTYNALSQAKRDLLRDNRKNDSKAPFYIFQAVHESIFLRVVAATKSKKAWDTLQIAYQGMAKVKTTKLQMLRRDIETLCMKEYENVDSFFTHVIGLVIQTSSHEQQAPHWSRASRHKFPLVKVEAEEDHMLEEEEEAHTKVEEVALQAQVEEAAIKIQVKAQDKIKHKARGMINLKSNVITFIDEEAWDESLEKTINVKACIPHEDQEESTATSNSSTVTPSTPIQAQQSRQQGTPSTNNRTMSHSKASASPSTPQSATPSDMSSPSSASTRRPKFKNLNEIYEQDEVDSSASMNSLFALFCHVDDLIHFEDAVKEEKWVATMEEEIRAIENNDTWELVNLPQGKEVIGVKWVYKTKSNMEGKI